MSTGLDGLPCSSCTLQEVAAGSQNNVAMGRMRGHAIRLLAATAGKLLHTFGTVVSREAALHLGHCWKQGCIVFGYGAYASVVHVGPVQALAHIAGVLGYVG